ncbi:MAG TPA: dTDP-4-dehydrorhamnose 3,5-epimerase [Methanofastidiosum sp.]|nr:dTDP-4-dehydrorhamnose 3,5-epimerase [Methanofastidiosum sp.]
MGFKIVETFLDGVVVLEPDIYRDDRGSFCELFVVSTLNKTFVQDNISFSKSGVLRGLHYQLEPMPQDKLVFAASGRILDVAVDLRFESPTFLKHFAIELSYENRKGLFVPRGFAHGFLALEDSNVFYKVTNFFNKELDRSIRWDDPDIGIDWPIKSPTLSDKDRTASLWKKAEIF